MSFDSCCPNKSLGYVRLGKKLPAVSLLRLHDRTERSSTQQTLFNGTQHISQSSYLLISGENSTIYSCYTDHPLLCIFGSSNTNCWPLIVEVSLQTVDLFKIKLKDKQNNAGPDKASSSCFSPPLHWSFVVISSHSCMPSPGVWDSSASTVQASRTCPPAAAA